MAMGPKIPYDPIELLTPDPDKVEPFINKYWGPVLLGTMGFVSVVFGKWAVKRPMFSGLQHHVVFTAAGVAVGQWLEGLKSDYFAERDAVYRHYIQLHPEDFPVPEVKKFAAVFEPWIPIR